MLQILPAERNEPQMNPAQRRDMNAASETSLEERETFEF
jgi:hypothetical protein